MQEAKQVSVEGAVDQIGSRFDLVLVASQRAREIKRGSMPKVQGDNGPIVTALEEIEQGFYTMADYLSTIKGKKEREWK
jgi:DNA-directed RNA polymerase subunit omega